MEARAGRISAIDLPDEARKNFGLHEFLKIELMASASCQEAAQVAQAQLGQIERNMAAPTTNCLRFMRVRFRHNEEAIFTQPRHRSAPSIPKGDRATGRYQDHGVVVPMLLRPAFQAAAGNGSAVLAGVEKA